MDKPKLAALILASKKPVEEEEKEVSSDSLSAMTLDSTLDDLFNALKSDNKDEFKKAFKKSVGMCDKSEVEEE